MTKSGWEYSDSQTRAFSHSLQGTANMYIFHEVSCDFQSVVTPLNSYLFTVCVTCMNFNLYPLIP